MAEELTDWLRRRVLGLIHVGRVQAGSKLPSIREMARRSGFDHRAVAEAYRRLEEEGLVEVRPASGVYAASDGSDDGASATGTAAWLAGALHEGWSRRLNAAELQNALRATFARPARVACVESIEDARVAIAAELEADFGVVVDSVSPADLSGDEGLERLGACDFAVTSVFHETEVRAAAEAANVACTVVRVHSDFAAELDDFLAQVERVTLVAVDAGMIERMDRYLTVTAHAGKATGMTVDETGRGALGDPVLYTRAARRRLGMEDYHLVPPPPSYIAAESALEIWQRIVRRGLSARR